MRYHFGTWGSSCIPLGGHRQILVHGDLADLKVSVRPYLILICNRMGFAFMVYFVYVCNSTFWCRSFLEFRSRHNSQWGVQLEALMWISVRSLLWFLFVCLISCFNNQYVLVYTGLTRCLLGLEIALLSPLLYHGSSSAPDRKTI